MRVDMSILQKLVVIAENFFGRVVLLERASTFIIEIGAGAKLGVGNLPGGLCMHLAWPAQADDADIQLRVHFTQGAVVS